MMVVPCYNEEDNIPVFFKEGKNILEIIEKKYNIVGEFIFVDDGSKDKTREILDDLNKKDKKRCHYIRFSRNFGKEAALLAGLKRSMMENSDFVVCIDVDGQHPLNLVPVMLQEVVSGRCECARGRRRLAKTKESKIRSFLSKCFYKGINIISDVKVVDGESDFFVMSSICVKAILALPENERFTKEILTWIGFRVKIFEYENLCRTIGRSKWTLYKLVIYSLVGISNFSTKPLMLASFLGLIFIIISFLLLIIRMRIIYILVLFCSGIQLLTIGILGLYLARVFTEVRQRPSFLIEIEK